jgi:SAM-dependent methyltransferase
MSAAERWREQLEAWALPQHLLDAVADSPYHWPAELWLRMQRGDATDTHTTRRVLGLLGPSGSLLDVGAGTGRASLPAAASGHRLTAVEPDPGMADGLRAEAERLGLAVEIIGEPWPEAAARAARHDVVLSANVVYNVADLAPFLEALHDTAGSAVVLECSPGHPRGNLAPYFRALHGLERPDGPTVDLLADVVAETLPVTPVVDRWMRETVMRFADLQEMLDVYRKRLLLPPERTPELADLLAPDVEERDGWLTLGSPVRESCTVWWLLNR